MKSKWKYLQKIIKGPASLSVACDRNVCVLCLIKTKVVVCFTIIIPIESFLVGPVFGKFLRLSK